MDGDDVTTGGQHAGPGASERLVVVGVDGSKGSSAALRWAADEARLRGATLKVVRAWQVPTFSYGGYLPMPQQGLEDWAKENSSALEQQLAEVLGEDPGVAVLREVVEAPPALAVVEAAKGAELVVVGSRGHGGFAGLLLGSVSVHVAFHAPCPVTIVRPGG